MTRPFRYQPLTGADTTVRRYAINARASTLDTSQVHQMRQVSGGTTATPSSDCFTADNENSKLADRIRPPLSGTQRAEVWRRPRTKVCVDSRDWSSTRKLSYVQENTVKTGDGKVKDGPLV